MALSIQKTALRASGINSYHYLDNTLMLAPKRWKFKRAIQVLNETFDEMRRGKNTDKTAMGRIDEGFNLFLFIGSDHSDIK